MKTQYVYACCIRFEFIRFINFRQATQQVVAILICGAK